MKYALLLSLLVSAGGLMQASIVETISLNLSDLNSGSTLSGTFTLPNTVMVGDTAPVTLTFSDPGDYSPASVGATITIESGTPSGFAIDFTELTFTNLNGVATPIDTKDVDITRTAFAKCTSFPCSTSGLFEDRSPAVFTAAYTITPAVAAVPEPGYALLVLMALGAIFGVRKVRLAGKAVKNV